MDDQEQVKWMAMGFIAQLPEAEQQKAEEFEAKLRSMLAEYGVVGQLVLVKIGA